MVSMFNSVQVDGILVQEAFVDVNETWVRRRGKRVDILYSQRLKESNARLLESKGELDYQSVRKQPSAQTKHVENFLKTLNSNLEESKCRTKWRR